MQDVTIASTTILDESQFTLIKPGALNNLQHVLF